MRKISSARLVAGALAALSALLLAACGGGSDEANEVAGTLAADDAGDRAFALAGKPVIAAQPGNASVVVGQAAQFRVVMDGSDYFVYQWYRDGRAIAGATSDVYVTPKARSADDGEQYSVTVRSSDGTVRSRKATLVVAKKPSVLAGRTWAKGKLIESGDASVQAYASGIDDAGRVVALLVKDEGARKVLYASHGSPGASGALPKWSPPVEIDMLKDGTAVGLDRDYESVFALSVSPKGNALAVWIHQEPCKDDAYTTGSHCGYLYGSRYLASTRAWEAPVAFASTPGNRLQARINDAGDMAVLYDGWLPDTGGYPMHPSVVWRAGADKTTSNQVFPALSRDSGPASRLGLDSAGRITLAGPAAQNGTIDIVAYRATVTAARFGAQRILDRRGSEATFSRLAVGIGGQVGVSWTQDNGSETTRYAAVLPASGGAWRVSEIGSTRNSYSIDSHALIATDSGDVVWQDFERCISRRWSKGRWGAIISLPNACGGASYIQFASNRDADYLALRTDSYTPGAWAAYVAERNTMSRTFTASKSGAGYVLGVDSEAAFSSTAQSIHLARNGTAVIVMKAALDALPTAGSRNGDGRPAVVNLWGLYLK